jgi:hypothetical protein
MPGRTVRASPEFALWRTVFVFFIPATSTSAFCSVITPQRKEHRAFQDKAIPMFVLAQAIHPPLQRKPHQVILKLFVLLPGKLQEPIPHGVRKILRLALHFIASI